MINQKNQNYFVWIIRAAILALVLNIALPVKSSDAKPTEPAGSAANGQSSTVLSLPHIPDKPETAKKTLTVRSSAYSSTRDQTDHTPFITAAGTRVRDGVVAMNGLPFGTRIRIPEHFGDKVFVIEDRMHARWGRKRVDIWMTSRQAARQWGVRTVLVEIL